MSDSEQFVQASWTGARQGLWEWWHATVPHIPCDEGVPPEDVQAHYFGEIVRFASTSGGLPHAAFIEHTENSFCIVLCSVVLETRRGEAPRVTSVLPTFCAYGRTFEGVKELLAAPRFPNLPNPPAELAEQLRWLDATVSGRGWGG